jgi:hypothetical protein
MLSKNLEYTMILYSKDLKEEIETWYKEYRFVPICRLDSTTESSKKMQLKTQSNLYYGQFKDPEEDTIH